jgi:lipopolysaccharide cholinephosphotransferase
MGQQTIKDVQSKILETMKFIDNVCRDNDIEYYIMGGTALGAIRHGGFIPWDDDLDIFMTPENYRKFKEVFNKIKNKEFVLQEWKITENYLEYSKVRMNGTTFIEEVYKDKKNMHHGIYVDIMILHKVPNNLLVQKLIYYVSKFVTLVALSQRNWKPKNNLQKVILNFIRLVPKKAASNLCYKLIYRYENLTSDFKYCYFITKANFKQGIFDKSMFEQPLDVKFENIVLMGPTKIKEYLKYRYGNYMKLPSKEEQDASVHAIIYDTERGFEQYINGSKNN